MVENPKVPVRIRQALNIEGGLNDGIAMPFLILFISLAATQEFGVGSGAFLKLILAEIGLGVLVGALSGYLGARYIERSYTRKWICWTDS